MRSVEVCVVAQLCLLFGLAGLFWPERFLGLFELLMFPFPASYRTVRTHCVGAIVLSVLLGSSAARGLNFFGVNRGSGVAPKGHKDRCPVPLSRRCQ